jgi:hypothetical protein
VTYTCPNGHPVDRIRTINCPEPGCRASVVYEPSAHGLAYARKLTAVRVWAELVEARHSDVRIREFARMVLRMVGDDGESANGA